MGLNVIGVAIPTEVVVCHNDLRADLSNDRNKFGRSIQEISSPKAVGALIARHTHHPGIAEPARTAEEPMVGDTENLHGLGKLTDPVLTQCVLLIGGKVDQIRNENLTFLTKSAGDESDLSAVVDVLRHRHASADGFVVWVCVHQKDAPV
jgi:hypothetical protein